MEKSKKQEEYHDESQQTLIALKKKDINQLFKKNSQKGKTGLQNLGNTCFMNSALQCISNTEELTKYFLFDLFKADINTNNPLGLNGNLASAFRSLIEDLWIKDERKTAPTLLKQVLGKRVARFSGFGQQDACELLNFLLDLLHEDLNRVKTKPYVEVPDHDGTRDDEEMSLIFWKAFLARNRSIIVDLMYGQLKSTVNCLTCNNVSITFDPFLTLSLPIPKAAFFNVALIPYDIIDEKDKQYGHWIFKFEIIQQTTVLDIKNQVLAKVEAQNLFQPKIDIKPEDLVLIISQYGEVCKILNNEDKVMNIDQTGQVKTLLIQTKTLFKGQKQITLNFQKGVVSKKGDVTSSMISHALPRFQNFNLSDTIQQIKEQIYNRISSIFEKDLKVENEWLNKNIRLYIKDNTDYDPMNKKKKKECEFCQFRHDERNDTCEIKIGKLRGNKIEESHQIKLNDLYQKLKDNREIQLEVVINSSDQDVNFKGVSFNPFIFKDAQIQSGQGLNLLQCFKAYSQEELLSGDDCWYCNKCKEHREIHKKLELFKLPKILIIQLKRFRSKRGAGNSGSGGKSNFFNLAYAQICQQEKVEDLVEFPIEGLDVRQFLKIDKDLGNQSTIYDLYAISNHFGGLQGGHYTAYGKNCIDGQWFDFNDSSVTSISQDTLISRSAYLLFYRRREDSNEVSVNSSEMLTKKETDVTLDPNNEDEIYQLD